MEDLLCLMLTDQIAKHTNQAFFMLMNSIQVRIDYDTKLQLMRDAEANKMTLSTLMRRLINLYLTDESVRQKVQ